MHSPKLNHFAYQTQTAIGLGSLAGRPSARTEQPSPTASGPHTGLATAHRPAQYALAGALLGL